MAHKNKLDVTDKKMVNLVSRLTEDQQSNLGNELIIDYDNDIMGRQSWMEKRDRWYKLWACERDPKTSPWVGASNICVPMLLTSSNQFSARAYNAIFAAPGMVKAIPVEGNDVARAGTVEAFMNWQTLYEMEEYEEEFDKLLVNLPINGTAFKKTFYDKTLDRNVSEYISAIDVVVPYRTKSLNKARRIVHRLWLHYDEMEDRNEQGFYENFDKVLSTASQKDDTQLRQTVDKVVGVDTPLDKDSPKLVLEVHKSMKMPWDSSKEPYIITVDYDSRTVLRITSRKIRVGGKDRVLNYFTDYHFFPNPEGFYSFGFGHFLEVLNEMSNTAFNQIFDSGRLSNMPFGFYGRRAGFRRKQIKLKPGEMIEVDDVTQVHFPAMQRVDQILFMVLGKIEDYSERIAANTDLLSGRQQSGVKTPTKGGTLAVIEQGLVTFGVLTKRIFRQLKKELRLIFALNSIYLPESKQFRVLGTDKNLPFPVIKRKDFDGKFDVIPVGDPTFASREMRRNEAIALYQILIANPLIGINPQTGQIANPRAFHEITSDLIDSFEKKNKSALLPDIPEPPISPDAENALFMQGDSRDPQVGENHQEHLASHSAFANTTFHASMPEEFKQLLTDHVQKTQALMFMEAQAAASSRQNGGQQQQVQQGQPAQSHLPRQLEGADIGI